MLSPGLYRMQSLEPKAGQVFEGEAGAGGSEGAD
jgi:hypothetical protein